MSESNELTLGQVTEALWRRRGVAVVAFILVTMLGRRCVGCFTA